MFQALIEEIQQLNDSCKKALTEERFEQGHELLNQRQSKVEALVEQLELSNKESKEAQSAVHFLRQLLADDNRQKTHFTSLKNESLQQNIKQKKNNSAVNKYQKIKHY